MFKLNKYKFNLLIGIFVGLIILSSIAVGISDIIVSSTGKNTYNDATEVPVKKTALMLGTSKFTYNGLQNLFYIYRINAVVDLYENEKVSFILVSGDNGTTTYNEPEQIKEDLIAAGIPDEKIFLDYAGFRTWDSIIRANKVFLENDFIIVSQRFQNERALYVAQTNDIDAIAYNAQDVPVSRSPRVWIRERLARVKVIIDAIINTKPKYLGETITIE